MRVYVWNTSSAAKRRHPLTESRTGEGFTCGRVQENTVCGLSVAPVSLRLQGKEKLRMKRQDNFLFPLSCESLCLFAAEMHFPE